MRGVDHEGLAIRGRQREIEDLEDSVGIAEESGNDALASFFRTMRTRAMEDLLKRRRKS